MCRIRYLLFARVVELVDTRDLKSLDSNIVPVQVRPRVPNIKALQRFTFNIFEVYIDMVKNKFKDEYQIIVAPGPLEIPMTKDINAVSILNNEKALTISELTACGKPSILIPFAAAAGDHQLKNAKTLSKKGASIIIEEKDFDSKILLSKINDLINDDSKLSSMSIASKKLGNKDATKIIVDLIFFPPESTPYFIGATSKDFFCFFM